MKIQKEVEKMKKMMVACLVFVLILITSISAFAAYLGDINNDGSVSAADARIILRHSAKIESIADEKISIADVDKNGNVNAADARLALRMSAKLDELIEDHTHDYKTTEIQKLDCKTDGIIEYKCSVCGHSYQEVKKAEGHKYSSVVTKHSSCGAKGEKTFTCSICNHSYTEEIPALEHEYFSVVLREPSCATGITEYSCILCGDTYTEELPAVIPNHRFTQFILLKESTCGEVGIKEYTCEICGEKKQEEIEKTLNHSYNEKVTQEPTYNDPGEKELKCTVCGYFYIEKIEALKITNPVYIHLPETPLSVDYYTYDSYNGYRHQTTFKITDISCDISTTYYLVDIKVSGEKTYGGSLSYSDSCYFTYKLYDMDGYIVCSGFCFTNDMEPGEKIRNVQLLYKNIEPGEYKLEILDYVN